MYEVTDDVVDDIPTIDTKNKYKDTRAYRLQTKTSSRKFMKTRFVPLCQSKLIITEGCNMCIECGFSSCVSS